MDNKIRINNFRRKVMRALTGGVGSDKVLKNKPELRRMLVCRPNSRLGNQLMITPLVQEIEQLYPHCKVDLFVRGGLSHILFENYANIGRIITLPKKPFKQLIEYAGVWLSLRKFKYDIVINVDGGSSSGRLATRWVRAKYRLYGDAQQTLADIDDYKHMAKQSVYNFRNLISAESLTNSVPTLNIRLSEEELENGKNILDNLVDSSKKTIGIYTFATGNKCFSREIWAQLYARMVTEYGEKYNILEILPIENVSQIDFAAPSYYSKNIREIAAVMANTELYFGADCGMMHLASAAQIPTIGLFSVTNPNIYRPYNKGSVAINPTDTTIDELMHAINDALKVGEN